MGINLNYNIMRKMIDNGSFEFTAYNKGVTVAQP
jgi:hypothetical protein